MPIRCPKLSQQPRTHLDVLDGLLALLLGAAHDVHRRPQLREALRRAPPDAGVAPGDEDGL